MTRIDRRALFASGAAAALLAASGVSLNAAPHPGGRLRIAVPRDDGSLRSVARGAMFDQLTEVGPDGALRGELAETWTGSADARDWLFSLRDGVVFHDGVPLTAAHAAATLQDSGLPGLRIVDPVDDLTLRIVLDHGNPDLPYLLSDPALAITAHDSDGAEVGTGAYRALRLQQERGFLGQKVENHYKTGRAGWVDTVEVVAISDPDIRAEALRDGFVDVAALPCSRGLLGRGEFHYHPSAEDMALAARTGVGLPNRIGTSAPLDDGRIAERWWIR